MNCKLIKNHFACVQKIEVMILCLSLFLASGCGNIEETPQDFFWEILNDGTSTVINNRVDGIDFEFCLLNEEGLPATRFREGENFSFYLAMTNHRNDKLEITGFVGQVIHEGEGFGRVISREQDTIGYPYINRGLCALTIDLHPFYGENSKYEMILPWTDPREDWFDFLCVFKGSNQPALPKGKYYTEFSHEFMFYIGPKIFPESSFFWVGPITFKINFQIE